LRDLHPGPSRDRLPDRSIGLRPDLSRDRPPDRLISLHPGPSRDHRLDRSIGLRPDRSRDRPPDRSISLHRGPSRDHRLDRMNMDRRVLRNPYTVPLPASAKSRSPSQIQYRSSDSWSMPPAIEITRSYCTTNGLVSAISKWVAAIQISIAVWRYGPDSRSRRDKHGRRESSDRESW